MPTKLRLRQLVPLPPHPAGAFDHGDVYLPIGRVFVANTAAGTIEVIEGEEGQHRLTIPGCPEASGVLCAQREGVVFAAARGAGKLLIIDANSLRVQQELTVGTRPNGLAWDQNRKHLLVADVHDNQARLVVMNAGQIIAMLDLPGRPRWSVYHSAGDTFLVNIHQPACVVMVSAASFTQMRAFPISASGPHGLALDQDGSRAFVACDGGAVVALDLTTGRELAQVPIAGVPDVIWHHHRLQRLYVAIGQPGIIEIVNTRTMRVEEQITTEPGTHTTAYDAERQRLHVFLPSCQVAVYEESEVNEPDQ